MGNALNSFMKYDKKWRGKEGIKVSIKAETDSDSEPVITENSVCSPLKIAEELEEKTFPHRYICFLSYILRKIKYFHQTEEKVLQL